MLSLELKGSISVRETTAGSTPVDGAVTGLDFTALNFLANKASKRAFDGVTSGGGMHTSAGKSTNGGRALRSRGLTKASFKGAAEPGFCDFSHSYSL